MKKFISNIFAFSAALFLLSSCNSDIEKNYISVPKDGDIVLKASATDLVLSSKDASSHTALKLEWDSLTYGISTPVNYTIQIDTLNGDFSNPVSEEAAVDIYSISYTDSLLNKKMLNLLKLTGGVQSKIKVRLKANLQYGAYPVYSNTLTINVTPYVVAKEVSYLYMPGIVGGDWNNYSVKICSQNNDGLYEGYVEAAQWANFKFTNKADGTGTYYGSAPNALYTLSSASDMWNIWFDEGGYFLVKADLNSMSWSKKAVSSFAVTGEFNNWSITANPMTYDPTRKVWTATCNISTVLYGIQIIGNADWAFKYGDTDKNGTLILGGSNITIAAPGTYTITMDLSNPAKYTYKIQ